MHLDPREARTDRRGRRTHLDAGAHRDRDAEPYPRADRDADTHADRRAARRRAAEGARNGPLDEVNVTSYVVRLMDGKQVLKEIGPVAVGKQVDTGAYESTQTGLFNVYVKTAPRTFDAPYNTYIQWWVGFDPAKDNGFHSFLLDKDGKVVDAGTGRISNGCIRTGAAEEIFNFAEIGMPVFVRA